jgi:hypothetical protein
MSRLSALVGPEANVRRTLDKFTNATLLEDKRNALLELKALGTAHPSVVGAASFPVIIPVLPFSKVSLSGTYKNQECSLRLKISFSSLEAPHMHKAIAWSYVFLQRQEDVEMLKGIIETIEACVCIELLPGSDHAGMEQSIKDNTLALTVSKPHMISKQNMSEGSRHTSILPWQFTFCLHAFSCALGMLKQCVFSTECHAHVFESSPVHEWQASCVSHIHLCSHQA